MCVTYVLQRKQDTNESYENTRFILGHVTKLCMQNAGKKASFPFWEKCNLQSDIRNLKRLATTLSMKSGRKVMGGKLLI